jgi:hypothetical protein
MTGWAQGHKVLERIAASQRAELDVMDVERPVLLRISVKVHQPKPHSSVNAAPHPGIRKELTLGCE